MTHCKSFGCTELVAPPHVDFCHICTQKRIDLASDKAKEHAEALTQSLSEKYPKHYKPIGDLTDVDVYAVHYLFNIQDPSGCLQHASRKLLLSGVNTNGKTVHHNIEEARDILTRWLELNSSIGI